MFCQNICLIIPILPGQAEAWRRFVQELQGPREEEWDLWCERIGLRELHFRLQSTSQHNVVIFQAAIPPESKPKHLWIKENVPFDRWLRQELLHLHGIDLAKEMPTSISWHLQERNSGFAPAMP